ncbi:lipoate--protein ligase [Acetobacterium wieringae]|uniref:lipoate--protein ligase n=1 Tax=Acetobacterium wieringae TaxID=52694 RepID=A0ABY6HBC8_9FIRM|nr:lipoate--protein ligase [Acetobacterium wieringae]MEA4805346.1 lipoate--protein ligase [Acetobacterium wieringae]UYO61758.1 lipoate--protein ligase [Acetobacterium wieringae]VUZ28132.1 Lipoate-protein ligase LplJ [Acetobacterium wieringae]
MKYIDWKETDPQKNLAFEEYVFNQMDKDESYFLLWQNDNAVIVGKHQNTIEEINQEYIKENDIKVVRRLSGGGAVYHDLGNLNFTFIVNEAGQEQFDFQTFTRPLVEALKTLGVNAEFNSRNDLAIDGKKFSGNSQYAKRGRILHHGTILFNSNLATIQSALKVKQDKIESKGIKSVKSRVTNIVDYLDEDYTLEDFKAALLKAMFENDNLEMITLLEEEIQAIEQLKTEKYATWDWNYGKSPRYNLRKERKCDFGLITVLLQVEKGEIKELHFYGDYFGNGDIQELETLLIGVKPTEEALSKVLKDIALTDYINGLDVKTLIDLILY